MRSLINKTDNIKYKNYQFTKLCKSDWVTYPKQQKSFFQKSWRNQLMAFSSVYWFVNQFVLSTRPSKMIFAVLYVWIGRSYTVL